MKFRVKVNTPAGPEFFYALGDEGLDSLLDRLYAAGPVNTFLTVLP